MGTFFFVYTIIIITVCVTSTIAALAGWLLSRRGTFVAMAVFFASYLIDTCRIFQSEYALQNLPFDATSYFQISDPVLSALPASCMMAALWYVLCEGLEKKSLALKIVPPVILFAASLAVAYFLPETTLTKWLYYSLRQVMSFAGIALAVVTYLRSSDEMYRLRLRKYRRIVIAFAVLSLCVLLEDAYTSFVWEPSAHANSFMLSLALSERNFSENILMLFCAVLTVREVLRTIRVHASTPLPSEGDLVARKIGEALPDYAFRHGLTKREVDILNLIIQRKTNQVIANTLFITEGTVKAHVHNILKKCDQETRQELIKDFWGEKSETVRQQGRAKRS